jgi:DNA-binding transcriptional ArsR family regulator
MVKNRAIKPMMSAEALELIAARFKALAEPLRLSILQTLEEQEMSVSDIALAVASSQPNVSKHLKLLQEAGILARRQEGNTAYYSIKDKVIFDICKIVCQGLQENLSAKADALASSGIVTSKHNK